MVKFALSTAGLEAKIAQVRANAAGAAMTAHKEIVSDVLRKVIDREPRDTHRLVRGWQQAGNAAGLGPFLVEAVRESRKLPGVNRLLKQQLSFWAWVVSEIDKKDKLHTAHGRKAVKNMLRAQQQLELLTGTSIFVVNKGRGVAFTVRPKIYGGTGKSFTADNGHSVVSISNREPHAIIRERMYGTFRAAMAGIRRFGIKRAKRRYSEQLLAPFEAHYGK